MFCLGGASECALPVRTAARWCIDVIPHHQHQLSTRFARGIDKRPGVGWTPDHNTAACIGDTVPWCGGDVDGVHPGGNQPNMAGRLTAIMLAAHPQPPRLIHDAVAVACDPPRSSYE